jgi:hypothetical protein
METESDINKYLILIIISIIGYYSPNDFLFLIYGILTGISLAYLYYNHEKIIDKREMYLFIFLIILTLILTALYSLNNFFFLNAGIVSGFYLAYIKEEEEKEEENDEEEEEEVKIEEVKELVVKE